MANSKYIKSYSNYVLRKKYQDVSGGTIFERDWTTIGGTNKFVAGQVPVYASNNFKITVSNTVNVKRKFKYGKWQKNEQGSEEWTWENVSGATSDTVEPNEMVLKNNYTSLSDFAYFGSCTELVQASITDIIRKFPAELYFTNQKLDYVGDDGEIYEHDGYIVENPFNIDIYNKSVPVETEVNVIRYMYQSYDKYVVVDNNDPNRYERIIGITANNKKIDCVRNNELLGTTIIKVENGDEYEIERRYVNNSMYLLLTKKNGKTNFSTGFSIRPSDEVIEDFFSELDYFQSVLLNRQTNYRAIFDTPYETVNGTLFTKNVYQWKTMHGWNLDINGINFSQYLNKLIEVAQYYDNTVSDNLYRSMTHEAIKNFDWSYSRKQDDELTSEYVLGGTKIENLIHVFGRQFDDIKRYIDGIKSVNNITYGSKNDLPNYLLTDSIDLSGFVPFEPLTSNEWHDSNSGLDVITDVMYPGENDGYVAQEVVNNFMRRFRINLKYILRAKGTKKAIEMLFSMFGVPRDWYSFKEYVYFADAPIDSDTAELITKINRYNLANTSSDENNYGTDEYEGILVKQFVDNNQYRLFPWFDKNKVYNGNPYFQSAGGWGKSGSTYQETVKYLNILDTVNELTTLPVNGLKNNDVYYINNQYAYYILKNINYSSNANIIGAEEGWKRVNVFDTFNDLKLIPTEALPDTTLPAEELLNVINEFYIVDEKKFYKLNNIHKHCDDDGWTEITPIITSIEDINVILYLDSIIDNNVGNNPHVGYGDYDGGQDFLNYYRKLFKYSIENDKFDKLIYKSSLSGITNTIGSIGFNIIPYEDNHKCWYYKSDEYGNSIGRSEFKFTWSSGNTSSEYFEAPAPNESGNKLPSTGLKNMDVGRYVYHLVNGDEDTYYRLVGICNDGSYRWNEISKPPVLYSGDWNFWKGGDYAGSLSDYTNFLISAKRPELLINTKKLMIVINEGKILSTFPRYADGFRIYYDNILLPFIKELIPSTTIAEFGSSLTVFKESIILMKSNPDESVLIDSSTDWKVNSKPNIYNVSPSNGFGGGTIADISYNDYGMGEIVFTNDKENGILNVMSIDITTVEDLLSFTAASESKKITVNAIGGNEDYRIQSIPSWCKYNKSGKMLTITATDNTTEKKREGNIVISHINSNKCIVNVKIEQEYSDFAITINPPSSTVPDTGGVIVYVIGLSGGTHNNDFNIISQPSWCTLTKKENHERIRKNRDILTGKMYLEAKVSKNTGLAERDGKIVIGHIDSALTTATAVIKQETESFNISVTPITGEFPQSGGSKTFQVTATGGDGGYMVIKDNTWLSVVSNQNNELIVTALPNNELLKRTGTITLTHTSDASKKAVITIEQMSGYAIEAIPDNGVFESSGGSLNFSVSMTGATNNMFNAISNNDWITIKSKTGNKLVLEASNNTNSLNRSGSVTIIHPNSSNVTDTILLTQKANTGLNVSPTQIIAAASGGTYNINVIASGGLNPDFGVYAPNMPDWVATAKTGNQLSIIVSMTTESIIREYNEIEVYNLNNTSERVRIKVKQDAQDYTISVTPSSIKASYLNYETDLVFDINVGGTYVMKNNPIASWTSITNVSDTMASLIVKENTGKERSGIITFAHSMDESKTTTLSIIQEPAMLIEANPSVLNFNGYGGNSNVTFDITGPSGSTYTIISKPNWVTITDISDTEVNISVDINDTNEKISGQVVFAHSKNNEVTTTVEVNQDIYMEINVNKSFETFDSTGGTKTVTVNIIGGVNPTYTVISKPDWVAITNTGNQTGSTTIDLTVSNNDTGSDRTGNIVLAHSLDNNIQTSISISQMFMLDLILESSTTEIEDVTLPQLIESNKTFKTSVDEEGGVSQVIWNQPVVSFDVILSGNSSYNGTAEIDSNNNKVINIKATGSLNINETYIVIKNIKFANNPNLVEIIVRVKPLLPTMLSVSPNLSSTSYPYKFKNDYKLCSTSEYVDQAPIYVEMNKSQKYTVKFDRAINIIHNTTPEPLLWYFIGGSGSGKPDRWNWSLKYTLSSDKKTMTLDWGDSYGETDFNVTCHVWNVYTRVTFSNGASCYFLVSCKNPHQ